VALAGYVVGAWRFSPDLLQAVLMLLCVAVLPAACMLGGGGAVAGSAVGVRRRAIEIAPDAVVRQATGFESASEL